MPARTRTFLLFAALLGGVLGCAPAAAPSAAGLRGPAALTAAGPRGSAIARPAQADTEVGRAQAAARRTGHRVEILSGRDETGTQYANPDGSFTLERATRPIRVRRGDGWTAVDAGLHRDPDGSLRPNATP